MPSVSTVIFLCHRLFSTMMKYLGVGASKPFGIHKSALSSREMRMASNLTTTVSSSL